MKNTKNRLTKEEQISENITETTEKYNLCCFIEKDRERMIISDYKDYKTYKRFEIVQYESNIFTIVIQYRNKDNVDICKCITIDIENSDIATVKNFNK